MSSLFSYHSERTDTAQKMNFSIKDFFSKWKTSFFVQCDYFFFGPVADISNKVWQNPNAFEKFKTKMKTYKKPQSYSDLLLKKCNKEL